MEGVQAAEIQAQARCQGLLVGEHLPAVKDPHQQGCETTEDQVVVPLDDPHPQVQH